MRRLLLLLALLAAVPAPAHARAGEAAARQQLFLELVLNGVNRGEIVPVAVDGARLWVEPAALREAGVALPGDAAVDIAALPGFTAVVDTVEQRLLVDAPAAMLPVSHVAGPGRARAETVADAGALLAYDDYVLRTEGRLSGSLWTEQRLFGPLGTLSNSGTLLVDRRGARYLRYDSRVRVVDEERALVATAGDLFTSALPWTGSVRLGGVQVARSYRVRPDLIVTPLPQFAGQAALPTSVDLYVNGSRQSSTDVAPGRYVLDNLPAVNGAGELTVVTTDAGGRQVATTVPFYVAPEMVRQGLTDFSAEAGVLRRRFGLDNLAYGRAAASGSLRHGVTARLTVEAHGEWSERTAQAGAGAVWAPGTWGALSAAVATSRAGGRSGTQLSVGYSYVGRGLSVGVEHLERSAGYMDLAGFDLRRFRGSGRFRSDRVSASVAIGRAGSFGLGYVDADGGFAGRVRLANLSWSGYLTSRLSLVAGANYDLSRRTLSAQLRLMVPIGRTERATAASAGLFAAPDGRLLAQAGLAAAAPTDRGLGYAVDAAIDGGGRIAGQASAYWHDDRIRIEGGAARGAGVGSQWLGASGAVVAMGGGVHRAAAVPDSFAVIRTDAPGVPVRFENQLVGRTDRKGRLLVTGASAYYPSLYAIDPEALDDDQIAEVVERRVAVRDGSGAVIDLAVRPVRAAVATLVDAAGTPIPAGARARFGASGHAVVGWGGMLLMEPVGAGEQIVAVDVGQARCTARLSVPADLPSYGRIGTVPCL